MIDNRKYLFAFLITAAIFATALFVSNYISERRLAGIQEIQDRIALDILAAETQSALLEETSCRQVEKSVPLAKELGELAERLEVAERADYRNEEVQSLKRQYFLLEIQDYLLMKKVATKCGIHPTFILYFYSNEDDCEDCQKMGFVLTALHDLFPDLRIYSFDSNMDLEAIRTLRSIYGLNQTLPALVVNGTPYYGFRPLEELIASVPALRRMSEEKTKADALKAATSTATTTNR